MGVGAACELLLVRHGLSTWNAEDRWQGQADPPLASEGEAQARHAATVVASLGFDAVVHSGLRRAAQTADVLVGGLRLPVPDVDEGLMEFDAGDWTGHTREQIEARWPGQLALWSAGGLDRVPGGEARETFAQRCVEACQRIASRIPGRRVLCVTHGGVIRAVRRLISGDAEPRRPIPNLAGRWVSADGDAAPPALTFGAVVHLLPPVEETESPTA